MNEYIDISNVMMPTNIPKINFNKRMGIYEISCSLFPNCNLNCNFCFQNHKNMKINIDKIMKLPDQILNIIHDDMIKYEINKEVFIRIYGGELFSDNIPDSIFDVYREFLYELNSKLSRKYSTCNIIGYWGSNGIFTNHNRVYNLLKDTNSYIALSYDPIDRFTNDTQKEIWYNTFEYFRNVGLLSSVSIMLIKPAITEYINGDEHFNKISDDVIIDVNQYIHNENYKRYQVNDDDIYNFYKWCIDNNKFNVDPIDNIFNNRITKIPLRHCYCKCSMFFNTHGYSSKNCVEKYSMLPAEMFYGKYASDVTEDNCTEVKNALGLQKRGCLYCQYYSYCPTICWTSILFKEYKPTICPISRIYEYIDNNPNIIDKYNKWRNSYEKC